MFKTGNNFINYLLLAAAFLPLLPVILIFLRKIYLKEQLNFLMIVCLLNFIEGLISRIPLLTSERQPIINNLFSLLELIALTQLFKPTLSSGTRNIFNIFLISFLSVILTYFSLKGWGISSIELDTLQSCIIIGVILLSLPSLIRGTDLHIFESPLFWIAGGTLFYFLIFILLQWVGDSYLSISRSPDIEKMIFLAIAGFIRYSLYTLAILFYRPAVKQAEN